MSNQTFQKIYNYLLTERLNEISNLNINCVTGFIKDNEQIILNKFPLEKQHWQNFKKELAHFLRASININYCYKEKPNLYDKLFSCKNKTEVQKELEGKLPKIYSISHNICKHIIKIIKFIKNSPTNALTNSQTVAEKHEKYDSTSIHKPKLTLDMLIKIINKSNIKKDLNDLSDEEINSKLSLLLENQYVIPSNIIDKYILKYITRTNPIVTSNTDIDKFTIINKDYDEKINQLILERDTAIKANEETQNQNKLLLDTYSTLENDLKNTKAELERLKSKEKNQLKNMLFVNPLNTISAFCPDDATVDIKVKKSLLDIAFNFFYKQNTFDAKEMRDYNMNHNDFTVNLSLLLISNFNFE